MPIPNYPHPTPDPLAAQYVKPNPTGNDIDQLPDLPSLAANLATWLSEVDQTVTMHGLDVNQPGNVLILAGGEQVPGLPAFDRAKVLNGDVLNASYHGLHAAWKTQNQQWLAVRPKLAQASNAEYFHVGNAFDLKGYAQDRNHGGTMACYTDRENKKIYINAHSDRGDMLVHEYFHTADPGDPSDLGWGMDEGIVDFFARDASARWKYKYRGNGAYEGGYQVVKRIVDAIGLKVIVKLFFNRAGLGTLGVITNKIAPYVKPSEEAEFAARLPLIEPLIADFCREARTLFPLDIVVPVPVAAPPVLAPPKKTWTVNVPKNPFRSMG